MTRSRTMFLPLLLTAACGDDDAPPAPPVDELALPGDMFFPESLTATADGAIFVGSLVTGEIVRFAPGETAAATFVAPRALGTTGVLADEDAGVLYACSIDVDAFFAGAPTSELHVFDLASGAAVAAHPLPGISGCNDLAVDAAGAVYASDSLARIYRLAPGATALEVWSMDPLLAPSTPQGFGVDGLALDGDALYANTFSDGRLLRIPVNPDGSAGAAVELAVDRPLAGPDGMRRIAADRLAVVTGASGELVEVAIAGDAAAVTLVASGLEQPTSVVAVGADYWVTEGQIGYLLGMPGSPALPFQIVRVPR